MTSDDQPPDLEALRSRLAAAVPPDPSVAGWAKRAAARARRRRARRRQALAVVSASCVAAAIAIAATTYGGNGDNPAPDTSDRRPAVASTPQPPKGMRYVGINSVVVAVPDDWELRTLGCYNIASEDTVLLANMVWANCAAAGPLPDVSLLRILPTESAKQEGLLEDTQPAGEINGIPVLKAPVEAETGGVARVLVVPDADAVFWLDAPDADGIERIFHTLTSLPDDYVALPSARKPWPCVRNRLEAAGIVVEIRRENEPDLSGGEIIDSKPMLGTVAKPGTTVTLTVPTGGSDKCLPPPTSPGQ